jgi:hypothetical protein
MGMRKIRHHAFFPKPKLAQHRRFPFVCFDRRKSFKYPASATGRVCPQCRASMQMLSRKFAAPRSRDLEQWRKVRFLVEHGFHFHSVFASGESCCSVAVSYPATMEEAKVFGKMFKPLTTRRLP